MTSAGSNSLRGSAYEFFGDRGLNSERTIDEKAGLEPAPYRNNQFGMTIGGPIVGAIMELLGPRAGLGLGAATAFAAAAFGFAALRRLPGVGAVRRRPTPELTVSG